MFHHLTDTTRLRTLFSVRTGHIEAHGSKPVSIDTRQTRWSIVLLLVLLGSLFMYKGGTALTTLREVQRTGTFRTRADIVRSDRASSRLDVFTGSTDYLIVVGPALLFGILIAGAVRTFVSPHWLAQVFARAPLKQQVAAGIAGMPLMLCSCCVAPVFSAVHERSRRLGPSLSLALAAPSLNPAALALTFMLFQTRIATARLAMGLVAVFLVAPLVARLGGSTESAAAEIVPVRSASYANRGLAGFLSSCVHVAIRTVPLILAGVVVSMWLANWLPIDALSRDRFRVASVVFASFLAVPIALPTFFEIPLALTLLSAGAPAGMAAAVLFAGPAVNLPSLITIARSTNWNLACVLALAVALVACLGGLLLG
jgi:uncharacterized membrane protein YraQ (UPF0718 family)